MTNTLLAAKDTVRDGVENCSVNHSYINDCIKKHHIPYAVVILDCCFSGTANGLAIESESLSLFPEFNYPHITCLTSCTGKTQALFETHNACEYAAFTYHFSTIIRDGLSNKETDFSFYDVYNQIKTLLKNQEPTIGSSGDVQDINIIPNRRFRTPALHSYLPTLDGVNEPEGLKVLLVKSAITYPIKADGDFGIPLGLWLLKSYIQRTSANIKVDIYDEHLRNLQHNTETFEECIRGYDVVGTSMCSCEVPPSLEKMRIAKENGKITVAGGIFTFSNEDYLLSYPFVDFVIPGVGTKPLERLLTELRKRKEHDPDRWKETLTRQIEEKTFSLQYVFSKANIRDAISWDAATMPHIELDVWDEIVRIYGPYINNKIDIYTSRGCNKTCNFCSVQRETKHNVISCDHYQVIRIISFLYSKGIRHFSIKDEDFFIDGPSRIRNILGEFKDYQGITFKVRARIDTMLKSNVSSEELAAYHISEIQYGVESPDSDMRKSVEKNISKSADDVIKLFKAHNNCGITVNSSFILGLPRENKAYYSSLISFVQQIYTPGLTKVYLNFYTPHPVKGKIPDEMFIVSNDLTYFNHKIPVCYPKNPRMKIIARQTMLETYEAIVEMTDSRAYNPRVPSDIASIFTRDNRQAKLEILRYGEDKKC